MKTNIERVQELSEKGMKPKDIAKELGISVATVYTYRSNKSDTEKQSAPTEEIDYKTEYEKLKLNYNLLEKENSELKVENETIKKTNGEISDELSRLEDKYKELNAKYMKECDLGDDDQVVNLKTQIHKIKKECNIEKKKHDALFDYLLLSRGRLNA